MRITVISFFFSLLFFTGLIYSAGTNQKLPKESSRSVNAAIKSTNINIAPVLNQMERQYIFIQTALSNSLKEELVTICKKLNISPKGTKEELTKRIRAFLSMETKTEKEKKEEFIETKNKDVIIIENAEEGEYLQVDENNQKFLSAAGEVYLTYNKLRLRADKLKINVGTKEMLCEGHVVLFDGSKELTGDKIFYDLNTEMGLIYSGKSKLGDFVYKGEKIKKVDKDTYIISRGQFTTCDEEPSHYYIEAKKLWIYPNNKIVMLDAYYVISGVKIFWIPLYLRFEKGTGIITAWGKRTTDGWFMQNTYRTKLGNTTTADLKFDHYQRRGEYAGIDLHQDSKDSEVVLSASGAYEKEIFGDSNINPDTGVVSRKYNGKFSFKNRLTLNRDHEQESYNTTIRASVFRQSDYAFIQNFETYRSTKPGFHFYTEPVLYNDLYNQDVNRWYVDLSDTRKNSSFYIKADWNYTWNPVLEEYKLNYANLPELSYSLNGIIGESPALSKNNNKTNKGVKFYPKIRYNTSIRLSHQESYDQEGNYLKSLDSRFFDLNFSRPFNLYNFINYVPSAGVGDQTYWAIDVDEFEKNNYERNSYSYGNVGQDLRMGPSRFYFNMNHGLRYRFKDFPEDEYGKIVSHAVGLGHTMTPIDGFRFMANTSYDLRTKRDERLRKIERDRFKDLTSQLDVYAINNITISERYYHSIRYDKPLTSNLMFNYNINDIPLFLIDKIDLFQFNTIWNHNFQNPRNSNLNINTALNITITKTWRLGIATHSVNERLYLYSKSLAEKYKVEETERNAGEYEHRNFFTDLFNSINIFQPSKMKESYFKLRSADVSVTHDLHCWEMAFGYSLSQRYFNYGRITQYPYFEHSFWLKVNMKVETGLGVDERIRTMPPDVMERR